MDKIHIYIMQILFVSGITYGSQSLDLNNKHNWAVSIARYVINVLAVRSVNGACVAAHNMYRNNRGFDSRFFQKVNRHHVTMFIGCVAFLVLSDQKIIDRTFPLIFTASLIVKYPEIEKKTKATLSYGVGMACSYFEGYLVHIIPSDGSKFFGFEENIRAYQDSQGVVFPVKKLFVIVTKSLYSPPGLTEYNKSNTDLATLEACSPLSEIVKDVAGVKGRKYQNTAYKIHRAHGRPVCLSVEGGTPMHTLHRVMRNRELAVEVAAVNREETAAEFLTALRKFIDKSPECQGKCELIYFDDTNPELNLADVLLDKIRELEPNFEEIIAARR